MTENKEIPDSAKIDLMISPDHLKIHTVQLRMLREGRGQAIGIGAGQQSRVHCTRLAGQKADNWFLRQAPQVLNLPFIDKIKRADRDNAIDVYIGDEYMDVLADGEWQKVFTEKPPVFTKRKNAHGSTRCRMWPSALTPSSRSATISNAPTRAA